MEALLRILKSPSEGEGEGEQPAPHPTARQTRQRRPRRRPGVSPSPIELRTFVEQRRDEYLRDLRTLVNIDCGTFLTDGVNQVADLMSERFGESGGTSNARPISRAKARSSSATCSSPNWSDVEQSAFSWWGT
jgi:hypothetical protein